MFENKRMRKILIFGSKEIRREWRKLNRPDEELHNL
jgi:hypothetical protein